MKDYKLTIHQELNEEGIVITSYRFAINNIAQVSIISFYSLNSKILQFNTINHGMKRTSFQELNIKILNSLDGCVNSQMNLKDRDELIELMDLIFDIVLNHFGIKENEVERIG